MKTGSMLNFAQSLEAADLCLESPGRSEIQQAFR